MKQILLLCLLFSIGISTAQAAKGTGPGISPTMNPNVKQGLVGMKVQPLVAKTNEKLKVTLYSYLPAGEKCEVYFKHPAQQYGPVKLLVSTSPYPVPNQHLPAFNAVGQYYIIAYTGTTGEHPCPQGKQMKVKVTIQSGNNYKDPPVRTAPKMFNQLRTNSTPHRRN